MNFEEKKALLEKYQALQADIVALSFTRAQFSSVREYYGSLNTGLCSPKKNYREDKIQKLTEKIAKLDVKIAIKAEEQAEICEKIIDAILAIKEPKERDALVYHYIHNIKIEKVAEKMHYSEARIYQVLKSGIENLKL